MSLELRYLFSMSCVLPGLVGLYRYRKMETQYHLLIYIMLSSAIIETLVYIGDKTISFEPIATLCLNAYMIIYFSLFLSLVKNNGYIKKRLQWSCMAVAILIAVFCWIQIGSLFKMYFYLLCFVTAIMLFISINILSKQIMVINTSLNRNIWLWISILFVIQTAYRLLVFGVFAFSLLNTPNGNAIGIINTYVNAGCYLLFIIPILSIPRRKDILKHQPS